MKSSEIINLITQNLNKFYDVSESNAVLDGCLCTLKYDPGTLTVDTAFNVAEELIKLGGPATFVGRALKIKLLAVTVSAIAK